MRHTGELVAYLRISAYDSASIPEDTDYATVLPVTHFGRVTLFEVANCIVCHLIGLSGFLHLRDEAWPGTLFQLIDQWRIVLLHLNPPSMVIFIRSLD